MSALSVKIMNLLAHAESAASEEEAEAYAAKAQELATLAGLDLEEARDAAHARNRREEPEIRQIRVGDKGKWVNAHLIDLFLAIARVNDVKVNIAHNKTYVIAYGLPSDIEFTERLWQAIAPQMVAAGRRAQREKLHNTLGVTAWQMKVNVFKGFQITVSSRLRDARKSAVAEYDTAAPEGKTGELVHVQKAQRVADFYSQKSTARGAYRGGAIRSVSYGAREYGHQAGAQARLGAQHSLGGKRSLT